MGLFMVTFVPSISCIGKRKNGEGVDVVIIDFDNGGVEGTARYSRRLRIDSCMGWHPYVKRGDLVKKDHDEYLLTKIAL
jgi:hypothetical protein